MAYPSREFSFLVGSMLLIFLVFFCGVLLYMSLRSEFRVVMSITIIHYKKMLENTEGAIKNGKSRKNDNKTKTNKTNTQQNMCRTPL
jgi:5-bromo-4-chloroindolyl phosphate hydrolysis protein